MSFTLSIDKDLSLRIVEPHHAPELFAVIDANRAHIGRWLPWVEKIKSVDDEAAWLKKICADFAAGHVVTCSILEHGRIVGGIGTFPINAIDRSTEIGYWLVENAQGRGIMTRACRVLIDYLFAERNLHRVTIRAATENTRSCSVIERLGLRMEGVLKQAGALPGEQWCDLKLYAVLAEEWPKT